MYVTWSDKIRIIAHFKAFRMPALVTNPLAYTTSKMAGNLQLAA